MNCEFIFCYYNKIPEAGYFIKKRWLFSSQWWRVKGIVSIFVALASCETTLQWWKPSLRLATSIQDSGAVQGYSITSHAPGTEFNPYKTCITHFSVVLHDLITFSLTFHLKGTTTSKPPYRHRTSDTWTFRKHIQIMKTVVQAPTDRICMCSSTVYSEMLCAFHFTLSLCFTLLWYSS